MGRILIIPLLALSTLCFAEDLAFEIDLQSKQPKKKKSRPACLRHEPKVREVVKAAWREAGLLPEDDRSRKSRVRASGWLPKVSGGVSKDMGDRWDYRYEPGTPRVDQLHQDDGLRWDVGLTWDLSKTVYQGDELQVAREASRRARERMDLAAEVIRLYFSRRRLMQNGLPAKGSTSALVLQETTATLDAFTAGSFRGRWCEVKP